MELPGTNYLYNLAVISVTFAGFAALLAAFRQMVGGEVTKHDAFLIRSALVRSLIVIICALLPPLLALHELPAAIIWRVSGLSAAVLIALFTLSWPSLVRRMVTDKPLPKTAMVYHGVQLLTALFLMAASIGHFLRPGAGHFAVGLSLFMVTSWISCCYPSIFFFTAEQAPIEVSKVTLPVRSRPDLLESVG
jgi:hypothetical protein